MKKSVKLSVARKISIAIISLIVFLLLTTVVGLNLHHNSNKAFGSMLSIPFKDGEYFCPSGRSVSNVPFEAATMLLVKKSTTYQVSQDILIPNETSTYGFQQVGTTLMGEIINVQEDILTVRLAGQTPKEIMINSSDIYGKIIDSVPFLGYIYKSFLGIEGYLIFGLCPFLIGIILISMIIKTRPNGALSEVLHLDDIKVMNAEVIRTIVPVGYNSGGDNSMDQNDRQGLSANSIGNDRSEQIIEDITKKANALDFSDQDTSNNINNKTNQEQLESSLDINTDEANPGQDVPKVSLGLGVIKKAEDQVVEPFKKTSLGLGVIKRAEDQKSEDMASLNGVDNSKESVSWQQLNNVVQINVSKATQDVVGSVSNGQEQPRQKIGWGNLNNVQPLNQSLGLGVVTKAEDQVIEPFPTHGLGLGIVKKAEDQVVEKSTVPVVEEPVIEEPAQEPVAKVEETIIEENPVAEPAPTHGLGLGIIHRADGTDTKDEQVQQFPTHGLGLGVIHRAEEKVETTPIEEDSDLEMTTMLGLGILNKDGVPLSEVINAVEEPVIEELAKEPVAEVEETIIEEKPVVAPTPTNGLGLGILNKDGVSRREIAESMGEIVPPTQGLGLGVIHRAEEKVETTTPIEEDSDLEMTTMLGLGILNKDGIPLSEVINSVEEPVIEELEQEPLAEVEETIVEEKPVVELTPTNGLGLGILNKDGVPLREIAESMGEIVPPTQGLGLGIIHRADGIDTKDEQVQQFPTQGLGLGIIHRAEEKVEATPIEEDSDLEITTMLGLGILNKDGIPLSEVINSVEEPVVEEPAQEPVAEVEETIVEEKPVVELTPTNGLGLGILNKDGVPLREIAESMGEIVPPTQGLGLGIIHRADGTDIKDEQVQQYPTHGLGLGIIHRAEEKVETAPVEEDSDLEMTTMLGLGILNKDGVPLSEVINSVGEPVVEEPAQEPVAEVEETIIEEKPVAEPASTNELGLGILNKDGVSLREIAESMGEIVPPTHGLGLGIIHRADGTDTKDEQVQQYQTQGLGLGVIHRAEEKVETTPIEEDSDLEMTTMLGLGILNKDGVPLSEVINSVGEPVVEEPAQEPAAEVEETSVEEKPVDEFSLESAIPSLDVEDTVVSEFEDQDELQMTKDLVDSISDMSHVPFDMPEKPALSKGVLNFISDDDEPKIQLALNTKKDEPKLAKVEDDEPKPKLSSGVMNFIMDDEPTSVTEPEKPIEQVVNPVPESKNQPQYSLNQQPQNASIANMSLNGMKIKPVSTQVSTQSTSPAPGLFVKKPTRAVDETTLVEGVPPRNLDADEILRLYRLAKNQKDAKARIAETENMTMTKLYYDDDIDSFTK